MFRARYLLATMMVFVAACTANDDDGDTTVDPDPDAEPLRINHVQVLSTHNSYKLPIEPQLLDALAEFDEGLATGLDYSHQPLTDQFDQGVRHIELDVFVDEPEGGHYAEPALVDILGLEPADPALADPGLKVLHAQEVDYRSTCPLLVACLGEVHAWSEANPGHLPLVIQVEPKDDEIPDPLDIFVQPIPWDSDALADLEGEIHSVFDDDAIITPAEVQGDAPTLREAVSEQGWPTLDDARGRVIFTLDDSDEPRDAYRELHPDPADRLMFVDAEPPDDDAAFAVINDPIDEADRIQDLIEQGFLVRTRADADTLEARSGDTTRRDAAWDSGAQFVTTDYIEPDERFGTGYVVEVPDGDVARCNPISAPPDCDPLELTEP